MNPNDAFFQQPARLDGSDFGVLARPSGRTGGERQGSADKNASNSQSDEGANKIDVDFPESEDLHYDRKKRQQQLQQRQHKWHKSKASEPWKSLNDDFEEVQKETPQSPGPNDPKIMELHRKKRLHKLSSLRRNSNESSNAAEGETESGMGSPMSSLKHGTPFDEGSITINAKYGDDDNDSNDNDTKPQLVVIDQDLESRDDLYLNRSSAHHIRAQNAGGNTPGTTVHIEVDFYNNPTILSRLILNEKYTAAMRRVYDFPRETNVWVCSKRIMKYNTTSGSSNPQPTSESCEQKEMSTSPTVDTSHTNVLSSALSKPDVSHDSDEQHLQDTVVYSVRQLPIHIACANLRRTHDTKMKKLLNDLIANLIFANPDGSHEMDHNGRYPIHEAIWHGATAETISLFLLAKPSSVNLLDQKNRSLQDVNKYGPGNGHTKIEIQRILELDEHFWKQARKEAMFRLLRKSVKWPSDSSSIGSLSVLASSQAEDESILTRPQPLKDEIRPDVDVKGMEGDDDSDEDEDDSDEQNSDEALASLGSNEEKEAEDSAIVPKQDVRQEEQVEQLEPDVQYGISPLSWDQLEARALATEQILMEMNEKYYEMSKKVEALSTLGHQHHSELVVELTRLSRENNSLNNNLHRLETVLTKISNLGEDVFNQELRIACAEVASAARPLVDVSSVDSSYNSNQNEVNGAKIREKLGSLSHNHLLQREKIRKLAHFVGKLVLLDSAASEKTSSDVSMGDSAVSALTSRSAKSYWSEKHGLRNQPIVDYVPIQTMKARPSRHDRIDDYGEDDDDDNALTEDDADVVIVDDLEDVFKFAAANDVQFSPRGRVIRRNSNAYKSPRRSSYPKPPPTSGEDYGYGDDVDMINDNDNDMADNEIADDDANRQNATGRPQRRNSILVRPEDAALMTAGVGASHGTGPIADVDIPALIPDDYEFEPIAKIENWEKRCFP